MIKPKWGNLAIIFFFIFAGVTASFAQDSINENELFSDTDTVTGQPPDASQAPSSPTPSTVFEKHFSGEIVNVLADIYNSTSAANSFYSYTITNLFLDVRMARNMKAFADVEVGYLSQLKLTDVTLREMFFDFNYKDKIYFRTGKQTLQWGRCYLWNPTDLINVEKPTFIRRIGRREGAYGIKFHAPFAASANFYGFLDTGNAQSAGENALALKYEFLVSGRTEMAFSGWFKNTFNPVFGYDFSTRAGNMDIVGEATLSHGWVRNNVVVSGDVLSLERSQDWTPRASVNFTRRFRLGNFKDRVSVSAEFFYNGAGYERNIFGDSSTYQFASTQGTIETFYLNNGLYEPNYYAHSYGALFSTVSRFILSDMSLSANYIRNNNDGTGVITLGTDYRTLNDLSIGILIIGNTGPPDGEYTFTNQPVSAQLTLGIVF